MGASPIRFCFYFTLKFYLNQNSPRNTFRQVKIVLFQGTFKTKTFQINQIVITDSLIQL